MIYDWICGDLVSCFRIEEAIDTWVAARMGTCAASRRRDARPRTPSSWLLFEGALGFFFLCNFFKWVFQVLDPKRNFKSFRTSWSYSLILSDFRGISNVFFIFIS